MKPTMPQATDSSRMKTSQASSTDNPVQASMATGIIDRASSSMRPESPAASRSSMPASRTRAPPTRAACPAPARRISTHPAPAGAAGLGPRHHRFRGRRPPAPHSFPGRQLGHQEAGGKGDAQGDQRLVVQVAVGMIAELGCLALAFGQLRLGIMLPVHSRCLGGMTEMLLGFHQLAVGGCHGFLARFDLFPAIVALVCYGSVLVN